AAGGAADGVRADGSRAAAEAAVVWLLALAVLQSDLRCVGHLLPETVRGVRVDRHFKRRRDGSVAEAALEARRVWIAICAAARGLAPEVHRELARWRAHDAHDAAFR